MGRKKSITSASVMSTIRAEWHRRNMERSAAANFAKTAKLRQQKSCHFYPHLVKSPTTGVEDAMAEAGAMKVVGRYSPTTLLLGTRRLMHRMISIWTLLHHPHSLTAHQQHHLPLYLIQGQHHVR
jgi:hypothetical protein